MDEQAAKKSKTVRNILIVSTVLVVMSLGLFYFRFATNPSVEKYHRDKAQEKSLQAEVETISANNNTVVETIEQTGKSLVSFSEDKIKYINIASSLSAKHDVRINKLSVSDIWQTGAMSGMTTTIEVEGTFDGVQGFVGEYCGTEYTNRINVISLRPTDEYPWLQRNVDGEKILGWFDLTEEQKLYDDALTKEKQKKSAAASEAGIPVADIPKPGEEQLDANGKPIPKAIGIDSMFSEREYKVYLEIDFLGRE